MSMPSSNSPGRFLAALGACAVVLAGGVRADDAARLGVMTHFAQNWSTALIPRVEENGISRVRDELYWDTIEAKRGVFVFPAAYDNYMAALKARGIRPLIALTFANRNYDGGLTPHTDEGIAAYARYAVEVLRHYGAQIEAVEIWNEYNGSFCKGPATADRSGTYLRMLKAAYTEIKRERPDVTVVGVSAAGLPMPYLERIFAAGGLDFMDAVSVHPYRTSSTPEGLEAQISQLNALIARYNHSGRPKPVWVTEIGWGTRQSQAEGDLAIDENTQARFLVRAFVLLLSAKVDQAYWYLLRDYDAFATMGIVRANGDAKPASHAMAALLDRLQGATFAGREEAAEGIYAFRFERAGGGLLHVLWSLAPVTLAMPASAVVYNLEGTRLASSQLLLGDAPVYVEGTLPELPPPLEADEAAVLADSLSGFSAEQGRNGWSYGAFVGDSLAFRRLAKFQITDWKEEWTDVYPYISLTAVDQHPSVNGGQPVSAVRRWTTGAAGRVKVEGYFKAGVKGDGVRVRVLAGARSLFSRSLGGGHPILGRFELETDLKPGETLDFAVDSGPAGRTDFDVTETSIVVRRATQL